LVLRTMVSMYRYILSPVGHVAGLFIDKVSYIRKVLLGCRYTHLCEMIWQKASHEIMTVL
jgi:hypothetical protein